MPTFVEEDAFRRQFNKLTPAQCAAFLAALKDFIADCDSGVFRAALRVHKLKDQNVWSMTWAGDGRATFIYGSPLRKDKRHIIWLSIGTHDIYSE